MVHVAGELDAYTSPTMARLLEDRISAGEKRLVVDLQGVTFMDSSGINALVRARNVVRTVNGSLRLAAPSERLMRVFTVMGLGGVFSIAASVTAACRTA